MPVRGLEPFLAVVSVLLAARHLGAWPTAFVSAFWIPLLCYLWSRRIAELGRKVDHYSRLALVDDMTSLPNGRSFREHLSIELDRAATQHRPLSLILMDVDQFKSFNDTFGHPSGDDALKTVGAILLGENESVYRLGGDEFAVVLREREKPAALGLAERIRASIESHSWPLRPVTASFGVASLDEADPDTILDRADRALYEAKRGGANRVGGSGSGMPFERS